MTWKSQQGVAQGIMAGSAQVGPLVRLRVLNFVPQTLSHEGFSGPVVLEESEGTQAWGLTDDAWVLFCS